MIRISCEGQGHARIREGPSGQGDYSFHVQSSLGGQLSNSVARDMLRVGMAAFVADRAFARGSRLGQQTRAMVVEIPVENYEHWVPAAREIARLAEFVSQDRWIFEFRQVRRKRHVQAVRPSVTRPSVNLFSDGLDSLCGAASALRRHETPILVSHSPPGQKAAIRRVAALQHALGLEKSRPLFFTIRFTVSGQGRANKQSLFPERSRRTRAMLYLSMAAAAAIELNVPDIYLNENGVLAINLPFRPDSVGPMITRHAHPETLRRFQRVLDRIWVGESRPTVQNALASWTKGRALKELGRKAEAVANETVTCEYARQQVSTLKGRLKQQNRPYESYRQCGLCFPCLVRRSAFAAAGLREPKGEYVFDARATYRGQERNSGLYLFKRLAPYVGDVARFCQMIHRITPRQFVTSYLAELSLVAGRNDQDDAVARNVYSLYQEFANEFGSYI